MYTYTNTRTSTLVDQIDLFLKSAGFGDQARGPVIDGVNERWIVAVGAYVTKDNLRVLESSIEISWKAHSDHADLTISADLPGWEDGVAPELSILASWLVSYAKAEKLDINFWVIFSDETRNDPVLYASRRQKVGVSGKVPDWKSSPRTQRIPIQDIPEAHVSFLDAR